MKKLGVAVLALVLGVGALPAHAGLFGTGHKKFPTPIDYPVVRKSVREYHKPGTRVKHLMQGADAAVASDLARA